MSRHLNAKRREAQERGDDIRRLSLAYALGATSESLSAAAIAEAQKQELLTRLSRAERLAARMARRKAIKAARKAELKESKKSRRQRGKEYTAKYLQYIQSDLWFQFRATIFAERGRKCEQCQRTEGIMHLHHLTYKNLGHEKPGDVKILCYPCHERIHGKLTGTGATITEAIR